MNLVTHELTRLRVHDVFQLEGRLHRVDLVNDSRARCVPIVRMTRTFTPQTGAKAGETVEFDQQLNCVNISPNSEVDIIGRWKPETNSVRLFNSEPSVPSVASVPLAEPEPPPAPPIEGEQQSLL